MPTTQEILSAEFEKLRVDLIKAYDAKGMRASGKTAKSLEVVNVGLESVKLIGGKQFEQLEAGRGPTSPSGPYQKGPKLVDVIKQWISDKGIVSDIKNDNDNSTLAFLIARKIHRQGWKREGYGGVELVSEVITDKRIQSIINKVGAELTLTIVTRLQDELKRLK